MIRIHSCVAPIDVISDDCNRRRVAVNQSIGGFLARKGGDEEMTLGSRVQEGVME